MGCHSKCKSYAEYRDLKEELYKKRQVSIDIQSYVHDELSKNIYKSRRKKHGF
ncbi:hypothetical protein HMPREF0631_1358 [Peptostreptococcus anaerobius 653-L]|uniref:Uncharacterized protein n=1 Tax=Peptostreptococcus anaerobius 653-L TaxID=596329 RepID=D3MU52_9FIRM|nr:hypothetical protein HMPREF0631_1358 [Peptostreptococcus anaerobius 653-L]